MPKARVFSSIEEFRRAHEGLDTSSPALPKLADEDSMQVRVSLDTEIKVDGDKRTLTFAISSPNVDRMGDTIAISGWRLDAYRKNPVVLWAHDSNSLPVGKSNKIWIEGDKLKSEAEFTPKGLARFNDTVFEMYKLGFLSATSVGFNPLKYAFTDDPQRRFGIDFLEQELLEYSAVPVPANADALIEGRSAGVDIAPMLDWCELAIKRAGDTSRIVKLAEDVLGAKGDNPELLTWATGIVAAKGQALIDADRLAAINGLADEFRADAKKASGSKGASGIYRRCANRIEKAVTGEEKSERTVETTETVDHLASTPANAVPGFAEIAARRLVTVRHKAS